MDTMKNCFSSLVKVPVVLAVLGWPLFIGALSVAGNFSDQEIIHPQPRADVLGDAGTAGGRIDADRQLGNEPGSRKVRVGLYENKPKIYTDQTGNAAGILVVILDEIARKENWQLTYVPCEWSACLEALENGRIELMPDVAFSPERDQKLDFHAEEVFSSWSTVYANGNKQLSKISDLDDRRIAVLKGSIQQTFLERMVNGFGFKVSFIEAKSFEEAFALTAGGAADAVVSNHLFGDYFHHQYGLEKTPVVFNPVTLFYATASGANPELLAAIDDNLRAMKREPNSIYYRALVQWMEKPTRVRVPPYLIWIISGISGLLAVAVVFILLLRWQVKVGTRHLADANKMLADSEKKFRDLFHKHAAVKLLIDPENGNIVEANEAAEKFYGWSVEQLRRMRIQEINTLSPEQVKTETEKARKSQRVHFEFRHRLADGSIRDVAVFSSGIDIQGKHLLHSIVHDITAHRNLEVQFRQAQKMESVGRLAGGVAHDFNNMLLVILGYTEMALGKIDPSDPLHKDLKEVLNAAIRSSNITRQLLAFASKQAAKPMVLDLNDTVTGMLNMLRRLIGENIDLVWRPGAGLWSVRIDPAQLDQILVNLCVNARDAINDVGMITIETANVTFDEAYCAEHGGYLPGEYVQLVVGDNGVGMDQDALEHAFEPFFTTKEVSKGTGLGLATVYGIVRQNSGFINIYSQPRSGTTFRLYFPRHQGKTGKPGTDSAAEAPPGRGETVLLVEDDQAVMKMGKMMLEDLGYQVLAAAMPGEALRLADQHAGSIDLVITDVVMPEMNGRELAIRLHALYPDLEILFMSGYTADVIANRGVLDEGVNFIQKPFSPKELAVKLRELLGRQG